MSASQIRMWFVLTAEGRNDCEMRFFLLSLPAGAGIAAERKNEFIGFLGTPLGWIMWAIYSVVGNFTVALILFTIVTKALLFPLSIKQQKNTARMAAFRPQQEALQKKYGNNKQKYQEELMKLYEQEGYNPMSGCLPLLIQFPILFGLIDVIYKPLTHIAHLSADTIEKMREIAEKAGGILGANTYAQEIDIINALNSGKASLFTGQIGADVIEKAQHIDLNFLGINLGERPVWAFNLLVLIPILSGITSLLVSIYSMKVNQAAQGEQAGGGAMKGMMYIMPLFSVFFAFQVPAGVGFYWIVSNLLSGLQTFLLNKIWSPAKVAAKMEADRAAGKIKKKKPSKFQEAMKAAQAQQAGQAPSKNAPVPTKPTEEEAAAGLSQKEINRRRLAAARKRDAEKYGEEYVEVTDEDLK